jgi:hypothetical protein
MQPQQPTPDSNQYFQSPSIPPAQMPQNMQTPQSFSSGKRHGFGTIITIILLIIGLFASLGFGIWAFMERADYKQNSDQKASEAVLAANALLTEQLEAKFVEQEKQPYDVYTSPTTAGTVKIVYPKTWSAQITEEALGLNPVNGYFHPSFVPSIVNTSTAFALRIEVVNSSYEQVTIAYNQLITQGTVRASAYTAPGVPGSLGLKLSGQINPGVQKIDGTMVILPIRDKTLKIWTESNSAFLNDFETAVLANLTYIP